MGLVDALLGLVGVVSATTLLLLLITLRDIRARHHREDEFRGWLEGFLRGQAENRRVAEMKILRHLKGEHYAGDLGGFEVFTDADMPPSTVVMINPPKETPGTETPPG